MALIVAAKFQSVSLMLSRIVWLLTALTIAGICILPVWLGFQLISYAKAGREANDVTPWVSVPGVSFRAREYALTSTDSSSDDTILRKNRDEVVELLAIRPLSSYYWLQLAESRMDTNEVFNKVSAAFELSTLTGRNEGYMITQRGLFGIWQWDSLSPENRMRTIADLAAIRIPDSDLAWLRKSLSKKTDQMREEIRLSLEVKGLPKSELARIGL